MSAGIILYSSEYLPFTSISPKKSWLCHQSLFVCFLNFNTPCVFNIQRKKSYFFYGGQRVLSHNDANNLILYSIEHAFKIVNKIDKFQAR